MEEKQNEYFYCYSPQLRKYLKNCGIRYEGKGQNDRSRSVYYMYKRGEELDKALNGWEEYKEKHMEDKANG